ncbi:uncharacterized protein F4822DRAFT_434830 [Hypoxylon trugodes]|uniref:uncharacterized protein n=1 Tax=Hypoxylon trugodes TaxID=326681 RepID=UPI002198B347|nr:uncharacterized protein F4822DRAFT_434830 [Hypoxylon trugodes]KAI1382902.1 hypothetical protein F4822DRAFT_434830 [Hypoxylon trugodes]
MSAIRRGTKSRARDTARYATAATTRRSTRSRNGNGDLVEKEAEDKEQPYLLTSLPLNLTSKYVNTGPGRMSLQAPKVSKVEVSPEEKERVLKALGLILQAACNLDLSDQGGLPISLDRNRDMIWDWRSVELSAKEYGAFAYGMVSHEIVKGHMDAVSYDWTPLDGHRGILSVRQKCGFQRLLTRVLDEVISDAMSKNELLTSLTEHTDLETQWRVPVMTGTVEGIRTPCRSWIYYPKEKRGKQKNGVEGNEKEDFNFVLEVGMGDKTPILRELAASYIKKGTLCVMTVKFERHGEYDYAWSYSLYRRGKAIHSPGQVTTYDMVCGQQDIRVKVNEHGMVEFPVGLTLFDFVPSSVLKKHGVTSDKNKKAVIDLNMSLGSVNLLEVRLGGLYTGRPYTPSKHLQIWEWLL